HAGRWHAELMAFDQVWEASALADSRQDTDLGSERSYNWIARLMKLDVLLQRLDVLHPGVEGCKRHALNRYLGVIGGAPLD
ncbi:hypothetical protein, partial [Pseudomonas syringae group genomosp. 7]|uniref:hypothetical protein n=1 Tax=Pseudomonas syringae group genomosp. 7 TaxID=251699 RepID=UPI00377072AA